jgi:hypothetical protein
MSKKGVAMGTSKARFVVYIHSGFIPRHYHKELSEAFAEATRLAKMIGKPADIIEYFDRAKVVGTVHPNGTMEQC